MAPEQKSTAEVLRNIAANPPGDMALGDFLALLGNRSFGLAVLVLAAPNIIPFLPGFASICSVPMAIIACQMILGMPCIRLPARVHRINFSAPTIAAILKRVLPILTKIEKYIRPRFSPVTGRAGEIAAGLLWIALAFTMFLPIPLGDPAPSLCAALIALGLLEKDGMLMGFGMVAAILVLWAMSYVIAAVVGYAWGIVMHWLV